MADTILSLYDMTGTWSRPYEEDGYEVRRVDLEGTKEDLRLLSIKDLGVDFSTVTGIIAQPPCTHFASSGARWWAGKGDEAIIEGLTLVDIVFRYVYLARNLRWWVMENPIGRLPNWVGKYKVTYNPHEYAGYCDSDEEKQLNRYTKKTCLWGEGFVMPPKKDLGKHPDKKIAERIHRASPSGGQRGHIRSVTPSGFAKAWKEYNP